MDDNAVDRRLVVTLGLGAAIAGYMAPRQAYSQTGATQAAEGTLHTNPKAFADLTSGDILKPVAMLNQLRFHPIAIYADGSKPGITGAEAYARYGAGIRPITTRIGAKSLLMGHGPLIGPEGEWDRVFVVRYPSRKVFIEMIASAEYRAHEHHRAAAVADSRLFALDFQD